MVLHIDFTGLDWHQSQDVFEKHFLLKALQANYYNYQKTAIAINIRRSHLYNLVKKYGIKRPVITQNPGTSTIFYRDN